MNNNMSIYLNNKEINYNDGNKCNYLDKKERETIVINQEHDFINVVEINVLNLHRIS